MSERPDNRSIACVLEKIADLLTAQDANPHRIRAYRRGAQRLRNLDQPVSDWVEQGEEEKLEQLPDIGEGLTRVISNYVKTGRSAVLERLEGKVSPEQLLQQVPGIGKQLSSRIVNELDIHSLAELEMAAYDGRLAAVDGFGAKRIRMVRLSLAGMLSQGTIRRQPAQPNGDDADGRRPGVSVLLQIDREYRQKAARGDLRKIAPKRFNPEGKTWLPILHTSQAGWDFTALFSNTARAHNLNTIFDWVVIYYEQGRQEGQATVVTQHGGPLAGKRVVRGRESESEQFYEKESK